MKRQNVILGAVIILFCGILSAFTGGRADIYRELERPPFAPPAFCFPLIWSLIYISIGCAAGAITSARERVYEADKYRGLLFFVIMMIFNFVWAPLFFGACAYFAAFVVILMMLVLTFFVICYFARIFRTSAVIMTLYWLWLVFMAYLCLGVMILN